MTLTYIDAAFLPFTTHKLTTLISSWLEPVMPDEAIRQTNRLTHLLLLSNHLRLAYTLLTSLQKNVKIIDPANTGDFFISQAWEGVFLAYGDEYPRLPEAEAMRNQNDVRSVEEKRALAQWHKYRECNRTGWMLEHCQLAEPDNPEDIWRETDDPVMLGMCCRLLSKEKKVGDYPPLERIKEALAVAKKLYALPQEQIKYDKTFQQRNLVKRHSYLLYRRLAMELAIRSGELETAAEFLGLGLSLDGFTSVDGGEVTDYLFVPGIWEVLPLLAAKGKKGTPYYIEESDAEIMVKEIIKTMELRAIEGRQWSLAPEKVGWSELLNRLAEGAWKVNEEEYRGMGVESAKEILHPPARKEDIEAVEKRIGLLPNDFKEMVKIANGFKGGWHLFSGGIAGIEGLEFAEQDMDDDIADFVNQDEDIPRNMVEVRTGIESDGFYHHMLTAATGKELNNSEEGNDGEYRYWIWAHWFGTGPHIFKSVREWVATCVEEVEGMVERGEKADDDC